MFKKYILETDFSVFGDDALVFQKGYGFQHLGACSETKLVEVVRVIKSFALAIANKLQHLFLVERKGIPQGDEFGFVLHNHGFKDGI